ncbi:hypothetical protein BCU94_13070 [Shewanella sp. 10N.286.52.C2]|uniref:hypothetical protein n=1 Tax=unclassified Shewanella TaxID=196818 RepID=UPI000C82EA4D|nr:MULTISPECIES: hypothetical protein [unclassified Shewanella]MDO6619600.1 hypothetical protein [Shewanella sp. 6_MG-2023]MDO6641915.1 hypothetical protein [Shewanella sp. 5_MG-2023]MDO6680254.1 hypothetical protein [Shewanella sp. 4_MG-2023]MDO6775895.1 hypothetical protein [Shewanella sp. 3_MG-2023]PMG29755.1 hypothetical protein BCU94_13070 [Shewanella sp. 10N.286.52.C2]
MKGLITAALLSLASSDCVIAPQDSLAIPLVQRQQLNNMVLSNEYLSGCVTEQLADITEKVCPKGDAYCCDSEASIELTYLQWENIYQHCMVK